MSTNTLTVVDMNVEWSRIYNLAKDKDEFKKLSEFYYTYFQAHREIKFDKKVPMFKAWNSGDGKEIPYSFDEEDQILSVFMDVVGIENVEINTAMNDENKRELHTEIDLLSSPYFWIVPSCCYTINGFFLYKVYEMIGEKKEICLVDFDEGEHVFLKSGNKIYDLYWQPMNFHLLLGRSKTYENGKTANSEEYWKYIDMIY